MPIVSIRHILYKKHCDASVQLEQDSGCGLCGGVFGICEVAVIVSIECFGVATIGSDAADVAVAVAVVMLAAALVWRKESTIPLP